MENFLEGQSRDGSAQEEGGWTLNPVKALQKLSEFRLPFRGAWAVKIIQAVVATGTTQAIKVVQSQRNTRFCFEVGSGWDYQSLLEQFQNPQLGARQDLNHLVAALWAVGLGDSRPFDFVLRGMGCSVRWDGEKLMEGTMPTPALQSYIVVSHWSPGKKVSVLDLGDPTARKANADVAQALSRRCFPCPVPLYLDNRRLDALQFCPFHGWGEGQCSMSIGFTRGDLPSLPLPLGTFDEIDLPERTHAARYRPLVDSREPRARIQETDIAYQVSYHAGLLDEKRGDGKLCFQEVPTKSRCHWVLHGAIISVEDYPINPLPCSLGIYLSAVGLETDLSSFKLRTDQEAERRKFEAAKRVTELLEVNGDFSFGEFASQRKKKKVFTAGSLLLSFAGLCSLPFLSSATAIYGLGTIVCGWAGYCSFQGKVTVEDQWKLTERMESDYRSLVKRLLEAFGGSDDSTRGRANRGLNESE